MLRYVQPHDLIALCEIGNTTLKAVSDETGLLEWELLSFAAGKLPLSAKDRIRIFLAVTKHAPPRADACPSADTIFNADALCNDMITDPDGPGFHN
jgi:hypothetical protein